MSIELSFLFEYEWLFFIVDDNELFCICLVCVMEVWGFVVESVIGVCQVIEFIGI